MSVGRGQMYRQHIGGTCRAHSSHLGQQRAEEQSCEQQATAFPRRLCDMPIRGSVGTCQSAHMCSCVHDEVKLREHGPLNLSVITGLGKCARVRGSMHSCTGLPPPH